MSRRRRSTMYAPEAALHGWQPRRCSMGWRLTLKGGPADGAEMVAEEAPMRLERVHTWGVYVLAAPRDDARRRAVYAWCRRGER